MLVDDDQQLTTCATTEESRGKVPKDNRHKDVECKWCTRTMKSDKLLRHQKTCKKVPYKKASPNKKCPHCP